MGPQSVIKTYETKRIISVVGKPRMRDSLLLMAIVPIAVLLFSGMILASLVWGVIESRNRRSSQTKINGDPLEPEC